MRAGKRILATFMAVVLATTGVGLPRAQAYADEVSITAAAPPAFKTQASDYDTSWYDAGKASFTITSKSQLKGLSRLVNSGTSFKGKTVKLEVAGGALMFVNDSMEPIGTAAKPFEGTFDGGNVQIVNLTLSFGSSLSYVGMFGYAGDSATVKNVKLEGGSAGISVTNTAAGKVISDIGAIAGHLGGNIENCSSSVSIAITNNGAVPAKAGKTARELCTVYGIGGLVGTLGGNMTGCTRKGGTLSVTSKSDVTENVPYIAGFVGGLAGLQGDESKPAKVTETSNCSNSGAITFNVSGKGGLDRFQAQMYSKSTMVGGIVGYTMGNVTRCKNTAEIQTGVVSGGKVQTGWGALTTGGIAGSLRGPTIADSTSATGVVGSTTGDPGYDVWKNSNGAKEPAHVSVRECENTGHIVGLASVGGICGSTGAFTDVSGSANSGKIDGTRWNKPCPAGIVGISNGDIAYCSNTGRVETIDGSGFYASGIVGLLTTYNEPSTPASVVLDASELYGCYVTNNIISSSEGYRAAVIAGENDGYIHDNCYLPGLTLDKSVPEDWQKVLDCIGNGGNPTIAASNAERVRELVSRVNALDGLASKQQFSVVAAGGAYKLAGGPNAAKSSGADVKADLTSHCNRSQLVSSGEDRGTVSGNTELTAAELRGSWGISLLNRVSAAREGAYWYRPNPSASGFPLLNCLSGGVTITTQNLASVVKGAKLAKNPQYSSVVTPVPAVTLETTDGRVLYQNADYKVVPQSGARDVTTGGAKPYSAKVIGMNSYEGELAQTVAYGIDKCDIGVCKVLAGSQTFNWKPQNPAWVKVVDEAGVEVPSSDYTWTRPGYNPSNTAAVNGKYHDYTNVHTASYKYDIAVTAASSSKNYTGSSTQAAFHIDYAQLIYESSDAKSTKHGCSYDKVVWGGQTWDYETALKKKGHVKITYTGKPIEPTIAHPTYLGVALRNGTGKEYWSSPLSYDFRYVYGNANAEKVDATGKDCVNVTGSDEKNLACMTIRYTPGGNFTNYSNVFFEIVPANMANIAVSGLEKPLRYTGAAITPTPTLTLNGVKMNPADYTLSYKNNVAVGTATLTITGKNNLTGTKTVQFKIAKGAQPMKVKVTKKTLKAKKLKKKAKKVSPIKVTGAKGKVKYKNVSKKKKLKKFKVNSKGKITVPKKTKKGTYKIPIKVTAKGNASWEAGSKTVTVKIVVKK